MLSLWSHALVLLVGWSVYVTYAVQQFTSNYALSMNSVGQDTCMNTLSGLITSNKQYLKFDLPPLQSDFTLAIPAIEGCRRVGVSVSLCESGSSSQVYVTDTDVVHVLRGGDLTRPARLDVIVFCAV